MSILTKVIKISILSNAWGVVLVSAVPPGHVVCAAYVYLAYAQPVRASSSASGARIQTTSSLSRLAVFKSWFPYVWGQCTERKLTWACVHVWLEYQEEASVHFLVLPFPSDRQSDS